MAKSKPGSRNKKKNSRKRNANQHNQQALQNNLSETANEINNESIEQNSSSLENNALDEIENCEQKFGKSEDVDPFSDSNAIVSGDIPIEDDEIDESASIEESCDIEHVPELNESIEEPGDKSNFKTEDLEYRNEKEEAAAAAAAAAKGTSENSNTSVDDGKGDSSSNLELMGNSIKSDFIDEAIVDSNHVLENSQSELGLELPKEGIHDTNLSQTTIEQETEKNPVNPETTALDNNLVDLLNFEKQAEACSASENIQSITEGNSNFDELFEKINDEVMPWDNTATETSSQKLEQIYPEETDEESFFNKLSSKSTRVLEEHSVTEIENPISGSADKSIHISEDLDVNLNDDDEFLKALSSNEKSGKDVLEFEQMAEEKFNFLEEDDDILLDDIMDDDLLDDLEEENVGLNENAMNKAVSTVFGENSNRDEPSFQSSIVENSNIPKALHPNILNVNSPEFALPNQKLVSEIKKEKKKSDAYDFPQDLLSKKSPTPVKKVVKNVYAELENSIKHLNSSYTPVPSHQAGATNMFIPPPLPVGGSAIRLTHAPLATKPSITESSKSSRSNSMASSKGGSFFAELPVLKSKVPLNIPPKINRYEAIEKAASLNNIVSPTPPPHPVVHQANPYKPATYSRNSSIKDGAVEAPPSVPNSTGLTNTFKKSNPYAPAAVGGHVRSISKVNVDPDEIKPNLIPVPLKPVNQMTTSSSTSTEITGFNSSFHEQHAPSIDANNSLQDMNKNHVVNRYAPNYAVPQTPAVKNNQQMPIQNNMLHPPSSHLPPHASHRNKGASRNKQSITSINEVYGNHIVTSNATSTGIRRNSTLPPISGKHPMPVNRFTPAPVVINPENLVRRQWPLFGFSAENKVVSLIPTYDSYNNVTSSIKVNDIKDVLVEDSDVTSFPGPLIKTKTKPKTVSKWIEDKIRSLGEDEQTTIVEELTWKCLKEMVEKINKPDDFVDEEYVKSIAGILNPSLNFDNGVNNGFDILELNRITQSFDGNKPFNSFALNENGMKTVHSMLEVGNKKSALEFAISQGDWTMALLVANLMGPLAYSQVTKLYTSRMLPQNSLGHDLSFFLQSTTNGSFALDNFIGKENWIVDNFRVVIPFIMMDNPKYGEALSFISHSLFKSGYHSYAKLTQILSGVPFLPQQVSEIPTSIYGMIISEIYDFVLISSGNVPPNFANGFPHMITARVAHAGYLADIGLSNEAKKYVDAAQNLISSKTILCDPITLVEHKKLCDRLSQVHSGWLSSRLSRPQLDKVWTTIDKSFNKFVAGEDLPEPEKKTEGVFSKFTSPASISRTSSTLDLNEVQHQIQNGGPPNSAFNNNRVPQNYINPVNDSNNMINTNPSMKYQPLNHKSSLNNLPGNRYAPPPVIGRYAHNPMDTSIDSVATFGKSASTLNMANENNITEPVSLSYPSNQNSPKIYQRNNYNFTEVVSAVSTKDNINHKPDNIQNSGLSSTVSSTTNKYSPKPISVPASNSVSDIENPDSYLNKQRDDRVNQKAIPIVANTLPSSLPTSRNLPFSDLSSSIGASEIDSHSVSNVLPPNKKHVPVSASSASSKRTPVNRYAVFSPPTDNKDIESDVYQAQVIGNQAEEVSKMVDQDYFNKNLSRAESVSEEIVASDANENPAESITNVGNHNNENKSTSESTLDIFASDQTEPFTRADNDVGDEIVDSNVKEEEFDYHQSAEYNENKEARNENVVPKNEISTFNEVIDNGTVEPVAEPVVDSIKNVNSTDDENLVTKVAVEHDFDVSDKKTNLLINDKEVELPQANHETSEVSKPSSSRTTSRAVNRFGNSRNTKKPINPYASSYTPKTETKKSAYAYAPKDLAPTGENNDYVKSDVNSGIDGSVNEIDMFSFGGYSVPEPVPVQETKLDHKAEEPEIEKNDFTKEVEEKTNTPIPMIPTFNKPKSIDLKGSPLETMFTPPASIAELNTNRRVSSPIHQFTEAKRYHAEDTGEYYDDVVDDSDEEVEADSRKLEEEKRRKEEEEREERRRRAEEEEKANAAKKANNSKKKDESGSWFGWLSKGKDSDKPKPIKAKLGEENSFYYDETLKRWINKKAPLDEQLESTKGPPPPPAMKKSEPASSVRSSAPPMGNPLSVATPTPPSIPVSASAPSLGSAPPPGSKNKKDGIDELLSMNSVRSTKARRGQRRGYVDVMADNK